MVVKNEKRKALIWQGVFEVSLSANEAERLHNLVQGMLRDGYQATYAPVGWDILQRLGRNLKEASYNDDGKPNSA